MFAGLTTPDIHYIVKYNKSVKRNKKIARGMFFRNSTPAYSPSLDRIQS